jgi:F0F1-type ATP synthase assembly protein I
MGDHKPQASVWLKQAGLLTSIPFVLLMGPAIGYYLGNALDAKWELSPWGMIAGIVIGLLASAKVTIQFIQQSQNLNKHD